MDDYVKEALDIVKAQAAVRNMTEDEITSLVQTLAISIRNLSLGMQAPAEPVPSPEDALNALKEQSVTCLECGQTFKVLTKKHLAKHGLTTEQYKEKYGYKKTQPLVCRSLQRERRKKMKEMRLWESRKKA